MRGWILGLGFGPSLLLASSASVLIAMGAPPGGWLPGHWLGFVPLIVLARRPGVTPRQAAALGLAGGLGIGLVGFPWLAELLARFAGMPGPVAAVGLLLFSLWMAIPYSLWALGLRLGPFTGWRSYAWPMVLFVALQFAWPNLFPYTPLIGFAERPELMQLAEIGGVPLLEAWVVGWAVAAARLLTRERLRAAMGDLVVVVLLPPLLLAYGNARMEAVDAQAIGAPALRVGIVQPNVPVGGMSMAARLERLRGPSVELARAGAELLVWPEAGAFPYRVTRPLRHDRELGTARVMLGHRVPTLLGAGSRAPGARYGYNSAYLIGGDGAVLGRYDKVNLVPFGEEVPVVDPDWLTDRIPNIVHLEAGEGPVRFPLPQEEGDPKSATTHLGPVICYEDIIPGYVRRVAALEGGVEFFVNVTIDAWYGDTAEPWEHLALAQFRSVEHRVPLVRSTSTGVSAVVDAAGRVVAQLPLRPVEAASAHRYPPETLVADLALARNTRAQPTPYAQWGWLLPHACVGVVLVSAAYALLKRRRAGSH